MKSYGAWLLSAFLVLALFSVAGCKRDPQVQKKHYVDKGSSYFQGRVSIARLRSNTKTPFKLTIDLPTRTSAWPNVS